MTSVPPESMSEDVLIERARNAMNRAVVLPVGSLGRSIQWAVFDTYMAELDRRAVRFVRSKMQRPPRRKAG
jgi:L-ribulose-5-phosphate 3-epimerase UlaE